MGKMINTIRAIKERDPAARNAFEIFFLYPGFQAVMWHGLSHKLYEWKLYLLARAVSHFARSCTGVEIHPGAKIGDRVFIDHGMGVVIGETAEIGDGCTIYQNVTLGGTGKDVGKRHPTLGKNVMVGSGAKILGPFTVGDNAKIAANSVVLSEVPPNATCVGAPARIVRLNGEKVKPPCEDLDQIHIPDPVSMELCRMNITIERLTKTVEQLQAKIKEEPENETV